MASRNSRSPPNCAFGGVVVRADDGNERRLRRGRARAHVHRLFARFRRQRRVFLRHRTVRSAQPGSKTDRARRSDTPTARESATHAPDRAAFPSPAFPSHRGPASRATATVRSCDCPAVRSRPGRSPATRAHHRPLRPERSHRESARSLPPPHRACPPARRVPMPRPSGSDPGEGSVVNVSGCGSPCALPRALVAITR